MTQERARTAKERASKWEREQRHHGREEGRGKQGRTRAQKMRNGLEGRRHISELPFSTSRTLRSSRPRVWPRLLCMHKTRPRVRARPTAEPRAGGLLLCARGRFALRT